MAVTVYLDSSDYSNLAANPNFSELKKELLTIAESDQVRFVYSGVIISEMAPIHPTYTASATGRSEILMALCRRNVLPSIDRLLEREFEALRSGMPDLSDPVDDNGNWFPDIGQLATPTQALETARILSEEISNRAQNRQQRRAARSVTFRKQKLRSSAVSSLSNGDLAEILDLYPMRPQDARVIERYVLGQATAAQADMALLESLRDPSWMMRWFEKHHDRLGPVTQWVRNPSETLLKLVQDVAQQISEWLSAGANESNFARQILKQERWAIEQENFLLSVARRLLEGRGQETPSSVEAIQRCCPGFTTWIRSTHSSMRLALLENQPRKPKASDFVDSLHSMYAPYVDLFRADNYMTPILRPLAKVNGTGVYGKLRDIPEGIANHRTRTT